MRFPASGWDFHFAATGTISIRDWDSPWNEIASSNTGGLVWTSDRTKEVWLGVFSGPDLEAWHE